MKREIPLSKPDITDKEMQYVQEVLQSGILSIGPKIEAFEKMIADYVGVKHAIGVNSGTSGLHLIIRALGIGEGDEVITTPFSFIASANCILFEKAKPIFVDIDPTTFNMRIDQIEAKITNQTKAILAVDVFGQPMNMEGIRDIAKKHNLYVIEDSCEALGSSYKGHMAGSMADVGVFAFYPNKQITTAEGGMIVTNDDRIAELCRSMRSQGRAITGLWLHHQRLGYNYRLSELHAALGVAQMERIQEILEKRVQIAQWYTEDLLSLSWVKTPKIHPDVSFMSWFVYVIQVHPKVRNELMDYLQSHGIGCKPYFTPIHHQPFYEDDLGYQKGDFKVTEEISEQTIALPFYTAMTEEEVKYVAETIKGFGRQEGLE